MSSHTDRSMADASLQQMRRHIEEALSASVHHASLAQQYLAVARRFSALADQQLSVEPLPAVTPVGDPETASDLCQLSGLRFAPGGASAGAEKADRTEAGSGRVSHAAPFARTSIESLQAEAETLAGSRSDFQLAKERSRVMASELDEPPLPPRQAPSLQVLPPQKQQRQQRSRRRSGTGSKRDVAGLMERAMMAEPQAEAVLLSAARSASGSASRPGLRRRRLREELRLQRGPVVASLSFTVMTLLVLGWFQLEVSLPPLLSPLIATVDDGEAAIADAEEMIVESEELQPVLIPEAIPDIPDTVAEFIPNQSLEISEPELQIPPTPGEKSLADNATSSGTGSQVAVASDTGLSRQQLIEKYGGSAASESAVEQALEWLAGCQRRDGSWDFPAIGECSHRGREENSIAATSYALLPFLAAGQTHRSGDYQKLVQGGLQHLLRSGVKVPAGLDFRGVLNQGDDDSEPGYAYYTHGAATLVLCETLARTGDRALKRVCEQAVRFLVVSQDPVGGGWRYSPRQPGSTSCTAIQIMALSAARNAGIAVPAGTFQLAGHYLDTVAIDGDGRYGYETEKKAYQISLTAMALKSRMSLGWGREDGDLAAGIKLLDRRGPYDNLYYCYFATQVLKRWGGPEWDRWNERMRDDLVRTQEQTGAASGSWPPRDRAGFSIAGGRLLTTCLAALTLEVYYRYPGSQLTEEHAVKESVAEELVDPE